MSNVAKLTTSDGAVLMPARSPYEHELVFENAAFYAARHGDAKLEFSSPRRVIRIVRATKHDVCSRCGATTRQVAFVTAGAVYCRRCL